MLHVQFQQNKFLICTAPQLNTTPKKVFFIRVPALYGQLNSLTFPLQFHYQLTNNPRLQYITSMVTVLVYIHLQDVTYSSMKVPLLLSFFKKIP